MKFANSIVNYKNPKSLGNRFRNNRFRQFLGFLKKMEKPLTILDIGGTENFWLNRGMSYDEVDITLINLNKIEVTTSHFKNLQGSALDLNMFEDKEFDIVFSNSVIEHLYTGENQKKMADEIMRVGKFFFVQSPNKYFFMESHFVLPLFQFLPKSFQLFILTKTKLSRGKRRELAWAKDYLEQLKLLSRTDMKKLFPGSQISAEKILFMNKSFTAHNFDKLD
jgi:predicted SAM-dependent methyltransferase